MLHKINSGSIATIKTVGYVGAFAIFEYLGIPQMQLSILGVLMIIDFISGVGKQWRLDPHQITSHNAWLGAVKKIATISSIFSVALILKGLEISPDEYIKGILSILIMAEGYSVIQNIYTIRTGIKLPEYDVISILLNNLGKIIKDSIEKSITKK